MLTKLPDLTDCNCVGTKYHRTASRSLWYASLILAQATKFPDLMNCNHVGTKHDSSASRPLCYASPTFH